MRILIVDDEFAAISKLKVLLSGYGECDNAMSSLEAMKMHLEAIHGKNPYGLVTLDIEMPVMGGLELIERMTDLERKSEVPLSRKIMISASSTTKNVLEAAQKKCDGFIVKPVRKRVLEAKLEELGITKDNAEP